MNPNAVHIFAAEVSRQTVFSVHKYLLASRYDPAKNPIFFTVGRMAITKDLVSKATICRGIVEL